MARENEDFGGGDGIEPFLDPAPDGREEGWCTNDLRAAFVSAQGRVSKVGWIPTKILSSVSG